ncbi:MAG: hypothetical protein ACKV2V_20040 [Blastocatellia bacterium]
MTRYLISFAFCVLSVLSAAAGTLPVVMENKHKVETIGAAKAEGVAEAVRTALDEKGYRVSEATGKVVCEIWFRSDIATVKAEVDGAGFAQLQDGSLMGVINFPKDTSDYRGQGIRAGWYTLRYAIMPVNGSHLGVSPTRDFFVLCPAAEDKDPDKQIKGEDLIKLSSGAAGSGHVSPWSLVSVGSKEGLPRIETTEEGHVILEVSLKTKSGEQPLGITVIGKTEG